MKTNFEKWLNKVNEERKEYWDTNYSYREYRPLTYIKGSKYVKIIDEGSVWAFVTMKDGFVGRSYVKEGDLLRAVTYRTPAPIARGNIFDGTDSWNYWGPLYLR